MKVKSLSRIRLLATPWTSAYQAPPSMGFSRQGYLSGVPLPSAQGAIGGGSSQRNGDRVALSLLRQRAEGLGQRHPWTTSRKFDKRADDG